MRHQCRTFILLEAIVLSEIAVATSVNIYIVQSQSNLSKIMDGVKSESQQLYGQIVRLGHTCGFISFHWDRSAVALEYDGSKVRKIWQALLFIGLTVYQSFLGFQCWRALENQQADTKQQIGLLYATIITIFLSINHYVHIFHGHDYVRLINASRTFVSSRNAGGK